MLRKPDRNAAPSSAHNAEQHAHDQSDEVEDHRTTSKPNGAQYRVRLASSVKMIEKDDVIKR